MTVAPTDLPALRAKLAGRSGPAFWRSLDELADTPEFRDFLSHEFPALSPPRGGPDRRRFLKLMAASLALGGLAGCDRGGGGRGYIVPYVHQPTRVIPGAALDYASATLTDGFAVGALITTRDGRPIKVEGNEQHPWTRGGTDIFAQASVLDLYDPDRSQSVRYLGRISDWPSFRGVMAGNFAGLKAIGGRGLRILTGPVTSPTLAAQIGAMRKDFPEMHWHMHVPAGRDGGYRSTRELFGNALETRWRFDQAAVVVGLDADFLDAGPQQVGASREWMDARHAAAAKGELLALHVAAPTPTLTSAKADHHVAAGPADIAGLALALLAASSGQAPPPGQSGAVAHWCARAWSALDGARGRGILLAGARQPAAVHTACHLVNAALGNAGRTVFHTAPALAQAEPLDALARAMHAGEVTTLVILDANPSYSAAADLRFDEALQRVPLKIHGGFYIDETASHCDWHVSMTHPLESWADARSFDGTISVIQPTVEPLYGGRTATEVLSAMTEANPRDALTIMRAHWQGDQKDAEFEPVWRQTLLEGFLRGSAFPPEALGPPATPPAPPSAAPPPPPGGKGAPVLDLVFRPDPTIHDGSWANNGWLQELPKPLSKVVWDNYVAVSPKLAEREQLSNGDVVTLAYKGRTVDGPVWVLPGQADNTVTAYLGYGRRLPDMLLSGLGYDAYALRSFDDPWQVSGLTLRKAGRQRKLVTTQIQNTMEGHDFVRVQHLGETPVGDDTAFTQPTIFPPRGKADHRAWGMVIDNDRCIGCHACVVACQAENNIPVVGKDQVADGHLMHWLRIDRYYQGGLDDPDTHFMPVPCMHCEQAPCELGCPVEATVHDYEGLNLMVYNRCIGTRACSGYCPYKVRHFNFTDYTYDSPPSIQARYNPDVTVRARGVMEKCTYCVQRIAEARIVSDRDNIPIPDGSVETACQNACPTRAIVFGDLADSQSKVKAARGDPRNYALLGELNTRPRTTYLAELAPKLEQAAEAGGKGKA